LKFGKLIARRRYTKGTKAEEKGKRLHFSHRGFYEPYIGEPDNCSAVSIVLGAQLKISYLKWILDNYDSYKESAQDNEYWLTRGYVY